MSDPLKVSKTVSTESKTVSMLAKRQQPYLQNLNSEQLSAVEETEGPLLVLAGAGTGKTRVLTTKLSKIIFDKLASPYEVLTVTFTNKAANEMK